MADRPVCMTIAGTDSGGGAGVTADLATFGAHDVWGTCAITAVTAQDTLRVHSSSAIDAALVRAQIEAVARDIGVDAAKTGMLANADIVEAVAGCVRDLGIGPLVVDPVIATSGGSPLLADEGIAALIELLLPVAALVTPNAVEAEILTGIDVGSRKAAEDACRALLARGPAAVLLKGGHLDVGDGQASDCLVVGADPPRWLDGPRISVTTTHGTGCVLSAAIAARLARGELLIDAVTAAKGFVAAAMMGGVELGQGPGALDPRRVGSC